MQKNDGFVILTLYILQVQLAEEVVAAADKKTGEAKCVYYRSRIAYLYEDQRHPAIESSTLLLCNGTLKNNKGSVSLKACDYFSHPNW